MTVLTAADLEADPFATWAWLRDHDPVHVAPALGLTLVTRWDDVDRVTRDSATFSAAAPTPIVRSIGPNFMHADGAEHRRVRDLVLPLLRASVVREQHCAGVRQHAHELLAAAPHGLEAMADYAEPLAERLLLGLIGLPPQAPGTTTRWFRGLALGGANFEGDPAKQREADLVSAEIDEVLAATAGVAAPAAGEPPPGSLLAAFRAAGDALSVQDLAATVKLFIIGGLQEPRDLLGALLVALLTHPEQLATLLASPGLLPRAVEEAARWATPVGTVNRVTTVDVELSGTVVPAGTTVGAVLAAANHDPRRWTRPEQFDITRDEGPHLAYAAGPHACVGAAATRLVVREATLALLPRLAHARLTQPPVLTGYEFRGPVAVHLAWGPA